MVAAPLNSLAKEFERRDPERKARYAHDISLKF